MMDPEYVTWEFEGIQHRQVSPRYKHALLEDYANRFGLKTFIETGTCAGDTLAFMRHLRMEHCYSIELSEYYWGYASRRFEGQKDVTLIHGDSAVELRKLLASFGDSRPRVLFWLDAHDSGGLTAAGPSPLLKELEAIFEAGMTGAVLIDDWDAPVECPEEWKQEVKEGIVRLTR